MAEETTGRENDQEIEMRARNMGWIPEEEWDPDKAGGRPKPKYFKTAREFVDSVEGNIPQLLERNRYLDNEVTRLNDQVKSMETKLDETGKLVQHLHDSSKALGERAYKKGKEEALAEMRKAADEGDPEKFDRAKEQLDKLEEDRAKETAPEPAKEPAKDPEPKEPEPAKPNIDPETQAWVDKNTWFQSDFLLNQAMIEIHGEVRIEHPDLSITEQLDESKRRLVEKFPRKFGVNPAREAPSSVGSPGPGHRKSEGKRTFQDLPREDQESFERQRAFMAERGVEYTREEFLRDYQWE